MKVFIPCKRSTILGVYALSLTPRERANLESHEAKNSRPNFLDVKALRKAYDEDPSVNYMERRCSINKVTASKYAMIFEAQDKAKKRLESWKDVYDAFRDVK